MWRWNGFRQDLRFALGTVVGVALAIAAGRFVATQLYGATEADLLTIAASVAFIMTAAFLAMGHPALRATRVDPMAALRHE